MYDRQWKKFIANREILIPGDMLVFSMKTRRIDVVFVQRNVSDEDSSSHEKMSSSDDDITNSSQDRILVAQRARLTTHEKNRLALLVPLDGPFVGLLFATRLTSTNVSRHDMVRLPIRIHFHSCFPPSIFRLYIFYI